MALVDIEALRYHYPGGVAALDGVDLSLEDGLTVVAGPSGGGKSTLLRLLNGLVPHLHGGRISGRAQVGGHDVLRTPPRRLATTVGFVFQDAERQAVHTTVERDIAFGMENLGVGSAEMHRRVEEVMDAFGIGTLRGRTIATLSGGERQRVAVAGALVLRPRLLVLDEPLSQLDAAGSAALLRLCSDLAASGTAVIMSEHRLDEVLPMADALVTVATGRVRGPEPPAHLAATLDSAPQVVRLSALMGWSPPVLDAGRLPALPRGASVAGPSAAADRSGEVAWRLDGLSVGSAGLLTEVCAAGRRGEVTVLMGGNGSGKTTLLRTLAGLAQPRAGTVWRREGRTAYLPQNPAALLHRETVAAEVAWTARQAGCEDAGRTAALMEALGVTGFADSDPRDLSSGQRQRAAIAAVLAGAPDIVLLDEPTRGMDGAARDGLRKAVTTLTDNGSAVVLATHDSDLAATIGHRVLRIHDRRLVDAGTVEHALSGSAPGATQLGRLFESPGPVTVEAVAARLHAAGAVEVRA